MTTSGSLATIFLIRRARQTQGGREALLDGTDQSCAPSVAAKSASAKPRRFIIQDLAAADESAFPNNQQFLST